jgi:hypothetical protein
VCNTSGTVGIRNNLIRSVIVDFEVPITTTLTDEELRLSFVLSVATSGRPLPITAARIEGGTKVNLTLYHQDSTGDMYDSQTNLIVNVAFEQLLTTRVLRVNGVVQTTSVLCNTTDQMAPVHIATIRSVSSGAGVVSVAFSEPVSPCGSTFDVASLTLQRISAGVTELTPQGGSPSYVWYFTATMTIGVHRLVVAAGSVCDAKGNSNLATYAGASYLLLLEAPQRLRVDTLANNIDTVSTTVTVKKKKKWNCFK